MAQGMVCYHHSSQNAVAQCAECGKGICKDCYDSYGAGMGAGKALCFDCTEELVKGNSAEIAAFRSKVKLERIMIVVGFFVIGFLLTMMVNDGGFDFGMFLVYGCVGGSAWTIIKNFYYYGAVVGVISMIVSPVMTLVRFFKRMKQIKQCDEILASDARIIQEMRDYFTYTQEMENNAGVDLATLANQGGALFNNTYAKSVMQNGEKKAQAELRQGAVQIASNGEIVRSFDRRRGQAA